MFRALTVEVPAYVTFKWGTDATWAGSRSWVGLTVGAGYDYNIFVPIDWGFGAITYGVPSIMGEVNFGKRRGGVGLFKIRYSMGVGTHKETWTSGGSDFDLHMTQHAFDLIVTTGY